MQKRKHIILLSLDSVLCAVGPASPPAPGRYHLFGSLLALAFVSAPLIERVGQSPRLFFMEGCYLLLPVLLSRFPVITSAISEALIRDVEIPVLAFSNVQEPGAGLCLTPILIALLDD